MSEAEEYVEEEINKYVVDTFDGQEGSTYKYVHIDITKKIALEAVSLTRKEELLFLESLDIFDLYKQATQEKSHYYVASKCKILLARIETLKRFLPDIGENNER